MWIAFSLSAAFFFALVHVLDEYCVDDIFEKPWFGVITSSLASIVVFQLVPFVAPFALMDLPAWNIVGLAIFAGILIQTSQALYFKALSYSEAGIVASYWNLIPALLPFASYLVLGTIFTVSEIIGILILIGSSVALCILDSNFEARWKSFFLMLGASILQVFAYLSEEVIFQNSNFFPAFFLITFGLILTGMLPLLCKNIRKIIHKNTKKLAPLIKFFVLIEIFNLIALFLAQKGIAEGDAALVAAIETTMPAHAFLLSALIVLFLPLIAKREVLKNLPQKILVVTVMIIGVYLVS